MNVCLFIFFFSYRIDLHSDVNVNEMYLAGSLTAYQTYEIKMKKSYTKKSATFHWVQMTDCISFFLSQWKTNNDVFFFVHRKLLVIGSACSCNRGKISVQLKPMLHGIEFIRFLFSFWTSVHVQCSIFQL